MTQIKSRSRVRDLAEVYTHAREVNAMLDLVPDMFPSDEDPGNHDRTFLEPAAGHGNFLEEILRRKLRTVTVPRYGKGERFEHRILRCLASIYAIDICDENVAESRERLRATIADHVQRATGQHPSPALESAIHVILATNVICADTLADAASIQLVEYRPGLRGTFTRTWSFLGNPGEQLGLFVDPSPAEISDSGPVHYRNLAGHPAAVEQLDGGGRG